MIEPGPTDEMRAFGQHCQRGVKHLPKDGPKLRLRVAKRGVGTTPIKYKNRISVQRIELTSRSPRVGLIIR